MMSKVKCIKSFSVEKYDGDGFFIENSEMIIEDGSIWEIEEGTSRIIGGEISLISDKLEWLEISKETLKENFKVIT